MTRARTGREDEQGADGPKRGRGAPRGNRNAAKEGEPSVTISVRVTMDQHTELHRIFELRHGRKPTEDECRKIAIKICRDALKAELGP